MLSFRMFKKVCQQGRSERKAETYFFLYVAGFKRRENDAGDLFQHPSRVLPHRAVKDGMRLVRQLHNVAIFDH